MHGVLRWSIGIALGCRLPDPTFSSSSSSSASGAPPIPRGAGTTLHLLPPFPPKSPHCFRSTRYGGSRSTSASASRCVDYTSDAILSQPEQDSTTIPVEKGGAIRRSSSGDTATTEKSSIELVQLEYADLNLNEKLGKVGHVRIRQHVNPLSSYLSIPAEVPDWKEVFEDPTLPLMVDIGSGSGRFLLWLANKYPNSKNYLGLEIRNKLVQRAEFWAKDLSLGNIHFLYANATNSFEPLVTSYPGPLMLVSILCPDPYFKKRHRKRRVLQKPLLDSIVKNLAPEGKVFIESDVLEVALEMRQQFDALLDVFDHANAVEGTIISCDSEGWLLTNPMGIRTEREIHAEFNGFKIYRKLYKK